MCWTLHVPSCDQLVVGTSLGLCIMMFQPAKTTTFNTLPPCSVQRAIPRLSTKGCPWNIGGADVMKNLKQQEEKRLEEYRKMMNIPFQRQPMSLFMIS